jgi:hypothetical protein
VDTFDSFGLNFEYLEVRATPETDFLDLERPIEESNIEPVRVYLREMGAVPLLNRSGEVALARRMERGKLRDAEGH